MKIIIIPYLTTDWFHNCEELAAATQKAAEIAGDAEVQIQIPEGRWPFVPPDDRATPAATSTTVSADLPSSK